MDVAAQMISTMANLEGEETFEASFLGQAEEVVQERICDDELILIKGYECERLLYIYVHQLCISCSLFLLYTHITGLSCLHPIVVTFCWHIIHLWIVRPKHC